MKKYNYYYKKNNDILKTSKKETEVTYTTISKLNLRSQPKKQDNVVIIIPKDQKVIYLDQIDNDWYKIKYQDYIGYCMKEFLK